MNELRSQQAQFAVVLCSSCRIVSLKNQPHHIERGALCVTCGERTHSGLALCALCASSVAARPRQVIKLPQNEFALFQELRKNPRHDGLYEISMDAPGRAFSGRKNVKQLAQSVKNKLVERGVLEVVTVGGPQRRTVVRILKDNVQLSTGRGRPRRVRVQSPVTSESKSSVCGADVATQGALLLSREECAGAGHGAIVMPGGYESPGDSNGAAELPVSPRRRYTKRLSAFSQQTETDILESVKTIGIVRTAHEYNSSYNHISKLCKSRGIAIPLGRLKKAA